MSGLERTTATGARKAAILLSLLGEVEAAPILRSLPTEDLDALPKRWQICRAFRLR